MPNEKRARKKAYRAAKMAELRRAQKRRRLMKRAGVVSVFVLIALVLALATSGAFGGKSKTATAGAASSTTTASSSSTSVPSTTTTTEDVSAVSPLPLATLEKYLTVRSAPPRSPDCNLPSTSSAKTTTTTVPAKGNAVSIVAAPAKVGFPKLNGSSPRYTKFSSTPPFCINVNDTYTATMRTTAGTIVIRLLPKYAPVTVNNFVFLAGYHYFDGIVFHRVIPGFVDQGGDPTGTGSGGPGYKFKDELPKSNKAYDAGALAMANSGPNTNGSQFFIVTGNGGQELTPSYSVFGQVVSGLSAANKINAGGDAADNGDPPKITYKIESVSITQS